MSFEIYFHIIAGAIQRRVVPNCYYMSNELIPVQNLIYEIRGQKVMLDFDMAKLYQVETKHYNSRQT